MLAFYGDEETETEAEALFSREDAEDRVTDRTPGGGAVHDRASESVKRPS